MNIRLSIEKLYWAIIKRSGIKDNKKSYESWLSKGYCNAPEVSFIIQSHNKSTQIKHIVSKLRNYPASEIIVIDDGSDLRHIHAISHYMLKANEFVIRANDLYENVMYDKAIRFANGKYIVLLQDDDDFADLSWIDHALSYFSKYPQMVILGGNNGQDFVLNEKEKTGIGIPYKDFNKDIFHFVHQVDRAPMWLNKTLFEEKLRHIDFSFAPFQFDDCELCLRAWLNDLSVGWYDAKFTSLSAGGMRIWNSSFAGTQCRKNAAKLYEMYKDQKNEIDKKISEVRKNHSNK